MTKKTLDDFSPASMKDTWTLTSNKGVNFPDCHLTDTALTAKDTADPKWLFKRPDGLDAARQIDFVTLSFVKTTQDILQLRTLLDLQYRRNDVQIIAKIETVEAVDRDNGFKNFNEILSYADGVMIARGGLGAELGTVDVPEVQRVLVQKTAKARKPCIVATQMLESMRENPVPTRAEVTGVSVAILDGADVVMLSAETSTGADPRALLR